MVQNYDSKIIVVDKLTYAANEYALDPIRGSSNFIIKHCDICDGSKMSELMNNYQPDSVVHLAAESHVDRSIDGPEAFIKTNINGTYTLLQAARSYWYGMKGLKKEKFRFLHVSTDEVYGSLGEQGYFSESTSYAPNSPYSASKAASDHLVRAWNKTFGLPVLITNCSNNYGPYQFPEKLIPTVITKAMRAEFIPVYGDGNQVRDWLYVADHVQALKQVLVGGKIGESYCIGGNSEKTNIEVVQTVCRILDELVLGSDDIPRQSLIKFVRDRPGHDIRYAIDTTFIRETLGWMPQQSFESGIRETVRWYLEHEQWWEEILETSFDGNHIGKSDRTAF